MDLCWRWRPEFTSVRCSTSTAGRRSARTRKSYHELLGDSVDSNTQQIKEAYRKLQKKYHPDVAGEKVSSFFKLEIQFLLLYGILKIHRFKPIWSMVYGGYPLLWIHYFHFIRLNNTVDHCKFDVEEFPYICYRDMSTVWCWMRRMGFWHGKISEESMMLQSAKWEWGFGEAFLAWATVHGNTPYDPKHP